MQKFSEYAIKSQFKDTKGPVFSMFAIQDKQFQDDSAAFRMVFSEDGAAVFLSQSIQDLLGQDTATSIQDIISFEDDSAFIKGQSFNARSKQKIKNKNAFGSIRSGCHTIRLHQDKQKTEPQDFQFDWVKMPDGKNYLIASSAAINDVPESEDRLKKFVLKVTDFQDNKATPKTYAGKKELKASRLEENETAMFMQMSSELQAVIEPMGQFVRFNTNFSRMLGCEDADMTSKNFINLIHPDDRAYVRNALFAISENSSIEEHSPSIHFDIRMMDDESGVHWVEWQLKTIDGAIYALGRDITETKTSEQRLKAQEKRLQQAQSMAKMGHWKWMVGNDSVEWSAELYTIFGVERSEFKPSLDSISSLVHRRDNARVIQTFQRAVIEKRNYEVDFRIYQKSGDIRYIRCEGRCEVDDQGQVTALFGIMQDVTDRLNHERALKDAKEAAEKAYAAKSQFLANMSHELRTPLNAIIGFSEMMQRQLLGPIGTEKYLDYITGIRESGEHLLDLIADILDMSKIEAGKYELDLEEISLSKICKLAIHMMGGRANESGITLNFDIDDEETSIVADRRAVMQILLNLLSNSVKFTEKGGTIDLNVKRLKNFISISVADTGIGIPAYKIADITKPFEQVESEYARQYEGSGLGLSITKDLAELHGGKISVESEMNVGTTVTILLPYEAQE